MPLPKDGQAIFATYFTKNGKRLHKSTIVPYYDADGFVEELNNVVNGKNNYYEMVEEFQAGNRSIDFFKKLMQTARIAHDSVDTYLKVFIETRDNLFTKENGEILMQCNSEKLAFDYMQTNQEIWKQLLGEKVLNNFYKRSVYKEISYSYFYVYDKNITPFFLIKMYDEKYSKLGKLQAITFLIRHLTYERKHIDFNNVIELFIDTSVLKDFENSDLNLLAWNTFQMLADTSILNKALSWSKKSLETDKDNPAYLDTYANLLYKLGHTKEAIEIETKALELIDDKQKKSYQETLDKMKQGKPTLDIK